MMTSNNNLITFKSIINFINELGDVFSSKQHSLRLYKRLINKTTFSHTKAINKHIEVFRNYVILNREAITSKDYTKLKCNKIGKLFTSRMSYSENVFIDLHAIFSIADNDTKKIIWKHLLVLSALLDPAGKAKDILKELSSSKEADFLTNIISQVEQNVDPSLSPMEAVSKIVQSGVFNDVIGGMTKSLEDGSLDLGKIMGTVQTMVVSIQQTNPDSNSNNALNTMLGSLMSGLQKSPTDSSDGTDTSNTANMATLLTPLLSGLNIDNSLTSELTPRDKIIEEVDENSSVSLD